MMSNGSVSVVDCIVGIEDDGLGVELDRSHVLLVLEELVGFDLQLFSFLQVLRCGGRFIGRILETKNENYI